MVDAQKARHGDTNPVPLVYCYLDNRLEDSVEPFYKLVCLRVVDRRKAMAYAASPKEVKFFGAEIIPLVLPSRANSSVTKSLTVGVETCLDKMASGHLRW